MMNGADQGEWFNGVFCGVEIAPSLYAEEIAEGRYVIREVTEEPCGFYAQRRGEVLANTDRFQAARSDGSVVGAEASLAAAAMLLL